MAITQEGKREALDAYQRALNMFVEECDKSAGINAFPFVPSYVVGSITQSNARLGICPRNSMTYDALYTWELAKIKNRSLARESTAPPSDIDVIVISFHPRERDEAFMRDFRNRAREIEEKVFNATRILIHASPSELEIPPTAVQIKRFLGNGLVRILQD